MAKVVLLLLASVGIGVFMMCRNSEKPLPNVDLNRWWGAEDLKGKQDQSIRPFKVNFDPDMIKDLKQRLKNHRPWTPPLEDVGFRYGFNSGELNSWVNYWAEKYNFSERQNFLNQFPQFKTNIQGLDIHFIRVTPKVPANVQVLPLLLMHGWPGSVREFYEAIPLLTKQTPGYDFVFEVIVPHIPGYGFSEAASKPGMSIGNVAIIFRNLMHRLGFKKFYIQGGDWGSAIATDLATLFQEEVLGMHNSMGFVTNGGAMMKMIAGAYVPSLFIESHLYDRLYPLSKFFAFLMEEFGYLHIQATKPDTVGVGLNDSPAGLLAYILEKYSTWTKLDNRNTVTGNIEEKYTKDQLLDNLMLYWSTNSITTSMRLYAENLSSNKVDLDSVKTTVPSWFLQAKFELFYQPLSILSSKFTNIIGNTVVEIGGHFFAFEEPKVFADDVYKAVKAFREHDQKKAKTDL